MNSLRIGMYGGSFDPVHLGHLLVARAAVEEMQLDRIHFIPAAQSPFKPTLAPQPAAARLALLRSALAGHPPFVVDDLELRRGGVSYTVNTVRHYAREFPHAQLYYLVGADHIRQLPLWREANELARLVEFIVLPRPGQVLEPLPAPFRGQPLRGFPLSLSSSDIRERIQAGLSIDWLVPPAVAECIRNKGLYLRD
jgi:nicotinate-nucleotide adenylyltransferase